MKQKRPFSQIMILDYRYKKTAHLFDFDLTTTFHFQVSFIKRSWWGLSEKRITKDYVVVARKWESIATKLESFKNKWMSEKGWL